MSTKVLISRGTPRFCSEIFRAVGSVAFEDEVENAVTMTVLMRLKNSIGEIRESSASDNEKKDQQNAKRQQASIKFGNAADSQGPAAAVPGAKPGGTM